MKVLIYHDCDLIGKERKYVLLNDLGNAYYIFKNVATYVLFYLILFQEKTQK